MLTQNGLKSFPWQQLLPCQPYSDWDSCLPNLELKNLSKGPQFAAAEFKEFCQLNGIRHVQVAPYISLSQMDWLKELYNCSNMDFASHQWVLRSNSKISVPIQKHTTYNHGLSPAKMLFGRNIRSRLDLLKPNLEQKVAEKQRIQQFDHDKRSRVCRFSDGDSVC